ncbi:MAG: HPr family phosphocarrier protein [Anaerocolumna sp.]
MVSSKVVIKNPTGLHLRPASLFCKTAMEFEAKVSIQHKEAYANGKSVLGVLGACIKSGEEIEIICEGEEEVDALNALVKAVELGLGENIPT